MDLPWGDEKTVKFVTNVGLITSDGPNGPNIQSAEWTHHISYSPGLIAVCLGRDRTTRENILATKEFGVSLAATDQNIMASVAGGSHGKDVDKISALKELGFKFYRAKEIKALMVEGAVLNAECKVAKVIELGDHTMFVGEVLAATAGNKEPLVYHSLTFRKPGEVVQKPAEKELERIKKLTEKFRKSG
ncbi:flavin reductase family protein [Candidatus Woesearchaeota archaeon]|nr:flavin reductase family protein [Candidatus Woesearchaeota archaeon]